MGLFSHREAEVGTRVALGEALENGPDRGLAADVIRARGEVATAEPRALPVEDLLAGTPWSGLVGESR